MRYHQKIAINGIGLVMKIFCISLHKTGTTSLHEFAQRAGLGSRHSPAIEDGVDLEAQVAPLLGDKYAVCRIMKPVIESYDFHADIPWPGLYRQLAEIYPASRFVYVERNADQWWKSLTAHWSLNFMFRRLRPFELVQYQPFLPADMRVIKKSDEPLMVEAFTRHRQDVIAAIPDERLLRIDLTQTTAALQLIKFLGISEPVELQHTNKRWPAWLRLLRNLNSTHKNRLRFGSTY
jgi:hypothetical protein